MRVLAQLADGSSQWTASPFQFLRKRTRFELLYFIQNFSHKYIYPVGYPMVFVSLARITYTYNIILSPFTFLYFAVVVVVRYSDGIRRRRNYDTVLNIIIPIYYYYYYLCVYHARMYICKSLAIISDIVCVCVCVRIRSATAATTIGRTQCAHKLAFINNPKRLVSENDREREREREITVSTHAIDSYIYYYVFMYKRRIRCQITPSTFYY